MSNSANPEYIQAELGLDAPFKLPDQGKQSAEKFRLLSIEQLPTANPELRNQAGRVGLVFSGLNIIRAVKEHYLDFPLTAEEIDSLFKNDFSSSRLRQEIEILKGSVLMMGVLRNFDQSFEPSADGTAFAERLHTLAACLPLRFKKRLTEQLSVYKLPPDPNARPFEKPSYDIDQPTREKLLKRTFQQVHNRISELTQKIVIPLQATRSGVDQNILTDYDSQSLEDLLASLDGPLHDLKSPITALSGRADLAERTLKSERLSTEEKRAKFAEFLATFNDMFEAIARNMNKIDNITSRNRLEIQAIFLDINRFLLPYFIDHHISYSLEKAELGKEIDPESIVAKCSVEEFSQLINEVGYNIKKAFVDKEAEQAFDPRQCVIIFKVNQETKMMDLVLTANCQPYPESIIQNGFTYGGTVRVVSEEGELHSGMGMYSHQQVIKALGGELKAENIMVAGELWSQTTVKLPLLSFQYRLPI